MKMTASMANLSYLFASACALEQQVGTEDAETEVPRDTHSSSLRLLPLDFDIKGDRQVQGIRGVVYPQIRHRKSFDAHKLSEGRASESCRAAANNVQNLDAAKVRKGGVRDAVLVAEIHVQ